MVVGHAATALPMTVAEPGESATRQRPYRDHELDVADGGLRLSEGLRPLPDGHEGGIGAADSLGLGPDLVVGAHEVKRGAVGLGNVPRGV